MSKKAPSNLPTIGDRVKLRGRQNIGKLQRVDDRNWSWVDWDGEGPIICHLHELERLV